MGAVSIPRLGVGLQYTPGLVGWFPFFSETLTLDALEVLIDSVMAPLDGPGLYWPGMEDMMARAARRYPLVGHSNYGGDFGFTPLSETAVARRHAPIARKMGLPWVTNHCFYSEETWAAVWTSPVQFSRAELDRVVDRAKAIQDLYGVPYGHENAAYYRATPGSAMPEEEFLAELTHRADTYLHLDVHNLYSNSQNHGRSGHSIERFLNTIPLDRVIVVHMAGGRAFDGFYHDSHDTGVPDEVWSLLEHILTRTKPGAVILEYESSRKSLYEGSALAGAKRSIEIIESDLERARGIWDKTYGPGTRHSQKIGAETR